MQFPQEKRLQFFVYVIESPSAPDLYHDRTEADFIMKAVQLNRIPCVRRTVINHEAFTAALVVGLHKDMEALPNRVPILHISAHGSSDGVQLSSGELLTWKTLRDHLVPVNRALQGNLLLCMSTCEGYSGITMAMDADAAAEHAYFALVGNGEAPTWPETAVGFATFYHQMASGYHINDAVEAMCAASANHKFFVEWASKTRQDYIDYVKNLDVARAAGELRNQDEQGEKPAAAKFAAEKPARNETESGPAA